MNDCGCMVNNYDISHFRDYLNDDSTCFETSYSYYCGSKHTACVADIVHKIDNNLDGYVCNCSKRCYDITFNPAISSVKWPSDYTIFSITENFNMTFKNQILTRQMYENSEDDHEKHAMLAHAQNNIFLLFWSLLQLLLLSDH